MPNREIAAFYNSPKPRQEWIDGQFIQNSEDEEAWVELFIDLVYVVLLSKMGDLMESCLSISPYFGFKLAVIFSVMCLTRQSIDEYANRFYSHDLAHKMIYLIYTIGVFIQVLNIDVHPHSGKSECEFKSVFGLGFFVGVIVTRCSLLLIYAMVINNNRRARNQFIFDMGRFMVTIVVMIVGIVLNSNGLSEDRLETALLCFCVGQELIVWIVSRMIYRTRFTYPIDLDLMQNRWGTWVMIVIGEAVIQMLYQEVSVSVLKETYAFSIISIILMFSLAMQYYDACQCEWYNHALTKSAIAGVSWIWLHVPMTLFLFGVGASLKVLIHSLQLHHHVPEYNVQVFCIALGLCTFSMTLIRLTNTTLNICKLRRNDKIIYTIRVIISVFQVSVAFWFHEIYPTKLAGIQLGFSVGLNTLDVVYDVYFNPNSKVKRVFALSTRPSSMGNTLSRKSGALMNAMSGKSVNNAVLRRPSRPWAATNLVNVRSEKSEVVARSSVSRIVSQVHPNSNDLSGDSNIRRLNRNDSAGQNSISSYSSATGKMPSSSIPVAVSGHPYAFVYQAPIRSNSFNRKNNKVYSGQSDGDLSVASFTTSGISANNNISHNINSTLLPADVSTVGRLPSNGSGSSANYSNGGSGPGSAALSSNNPGAGTGPGVGVSGSGGDRGRRNSSENDDVVMQRAIQQQAQHIQQNSASNANTAQWQRNNSNSVSVSLSRGLENMIAAVKNVTKGTQSRIQSEVSEMSVRSTDYDNDEGDYNDVLLNKTLLFDGFVYRFVDNEMGEVEEDPYMGNMDDSAEYLANYAADLVGDQQQYRQHQLELLSAANFDERLEDLGSATNSNIVIGSLFPSDKDTVEIGGSLTASASGQGFPLGSAGSRGSNRAPAESKGAEDLV